jgi:hypothetical protein
MHAHTHARTRTLESSGKYIRVFVAEILKKILEEKLQLSIFHSAGINQGLPA